MKKSQKVITGVKAFNKDMTCNRFQYKEGKIYTTKEAKICKKGFHFCKNPLDILSYYSLCDSVFHEVESLGKIDKHSDDTKIATTKIKIGAELSLSGFIKASFDYLWNNFKDKAQSGDWSQSAQSGNKSQSAQSGDGSQSAQSGDESQIELQGKKCVGASIGRGCRIKGKVGCWITLAEYGKWTGKYYPVLCVKSAKIDGKKIKADTWYQLIDGKFKEANIRISE